MIKGLYVIYDSGICLYNKFSTTISQNDQLIAGFISALDRFCRTSIGENISYFCTESLKFHFIHKKRLIFVFISEKNDITKNLLPNFQQLIERFYTEFKEQETMFKQQGLVPELRNFDICVSNFCI